MASISTVSLREAIIPLIPTFHPAELRTIKMENKWTEGTAPNTVERYYKMYLPVCDDPSNKELFLYVVDQFFDAAHNDRLHLDGTGCYTKFRDVLGGDLRIAWQAISGAQATKSLGNFVEDVDELIEQYLAPTSYFDQLEYIRDSTKSYAQSCEELASRLRIISHLGKYLPGSVQGGTRYDLFTSDDLLKRAFFQLMPQPWKIRFAESGQVLLGTYTFQNLVRFMSTQEAISKRSDSNKRRAQGQPSGGRGGRGYGRGRGNGGNYQYRHSNGGRGGRGYQSPGRGYRAPASYNTPRTPSQVTPQSGRGSYTPRSGGRSSGRFQGRTPGRGYVYPTVGYQQPRNNWGWQQGPPQGRGIGGAPQLPTLMTDQYYQGQEDPYAYGSEEHYHAEEPHYEEEQYYGSEEQGYEQGYEEQYQAEAEEGQQDETAETTEAHWLDEFSP